MPRPIQAPMGDAGVATYTLGGREEWRLQAISFLVDGSPTSTDLIFVDLRTPTGGIIYRQVLGELSQVPLFFSLAFGAADWTTDVSDGVFGWPQSQSGYQAFITASISPQVLTDNCTVNVYVAVNLPTPSVDPITVPDTGVTINGLHLWVEDTLGTQVESALLSGPYMLVPGPGA